jgi:MSHA biogenesis protein MshJ
MSALASMLGRLEPLRERFDALGVRERGLIFGAAVVVIYFSWQSLLMDPLQARGRQAEHRLAEARAQMSAVDEAGAAVAADPLIAAATRNRALKGRLAELDHELQALAQGYVAPERVTQLLRELLTRQHGLSLVSLENLPVESLSLTPDAARGAAIAADDRGPFLHPVEIVVDGDYASLVAYLRAIEALPWRIHWQRLELTVGGYPSSRVRIVIGALSLSREWIKV